MKRILEIVDFLEDCDIEDLTKALIYREFADTIPTMSELNKVYAFYYDTPELTLISQDIIDKIEKLDRRDN